MKSAGKARSNGLYRHIRTSKEIIRNLLNDYIKKNNEKGMENQADDILNIDFAKNGKTIKDIEDDLQMFFSPQIKDKYKASRISPENRFGDYINKAFEICIANGGAE